jgi:hypothetical protein
MTSRNQPAVIAELLRVRSADPDGFLSRRAIVNAARPEESPLHAYFQWDDSKAADERRLEQAGQLVRRMRVHIVRVPHEVRQIDVEIVKIDEKPRTVRMAQAPRGGRGANGGYRMVSDIAADDVLASDMVDTLASELFAWIRRAQDYLDALNASGREERVLQELVTSVAQIAQEAWPSPLGGDGREGGDDGDEAVVVAQ